MAAGKRGVRACAAAVAVAGWAVAAVCAQAQTSPPMARPNCDAPEHRQLDFWAGEWDVFQTASGTRIASSRIERIMGGCAIAEHYESPKAPGGPYSGASYSAWDRKDGHWHQLYVDVNGSVTWYTGDRQGADLVMTAPGRQGSLQKMTYRPTPDGSVRQIGEVSTDGGKTWAAGYDYTYRKRAGT